MLRYKTYLYSTQVGTKTVVKSYLGPYLSKKKLCMLYVRIPGLYHGGNICYTFSMIECKLHEDQINAIQM